MNKRKQNKIKRELGIRNWEEVLTVQQMDKLFSCFYELDIDDGAHILPQIPGLDVLLHAYFDDLTHTIINYEPLIMYEFLDAKEYIGSFLKSPGDFKNMADACIDFSAWFMVESSVFIEAVEGNAFFTVAEAIELIRDEGDSEDGEEKLAMSYEGDLGSIRLMKDQSGSATDLEMAIEAMLEQVQWEIDPKDSNSRLN